LKTAYPFELPIPSKSLPRLGPDGVTFIDVRVKGKWEGVLVVNERRECVGVRSNRQTIEWDLPFLPRDIEDFRPASALNLILAENSELILVLPYVCLVLVPILILTRPFIGAVGPIGAILAGVVGQAIIIDDPKRYCVTWLSMFIAIFAMEVLALLAVLR
jgi:hypothetical protein